MLSLLRADAQERRIEDATTLVRFVPLVAELSRFVVPATEIFSVHPHLREDGYRRAVHEASDAFVVGDVRCFFSASLDGIAVSDSAFHETSPAFGEADHSTAVAVAVLLDGLLPGRLVAQRHLLGSGLESPFEHEVLAALTFFGFALLFLVLGRLHILLVAAIRLVRVERRDRIRLVARICGEGDAVEVGLDLLLGLVRQSDHALGGFADVFASHCFVLFHDVPLFWFEFEVSVSFDFLRLPCGASGVGLEPQSRLWFDVQRRPAPLDWSFDACPDAQPATACLPNS